MGKKEPDFQMVKKIADEYFKIPVQMERVKEGAGTYVYRTQLKDKAFYLRILPNGASFAVEVKIHNLLLKHGVQVPKVIYFEDKNAALGLSIMIEEEIPGDSIHKSPPKANIDQILYQAGKQVALINTFKVDGFGRINRRNYDKLTAESKSFKEYYYGQISKAMDLLHQEDFTNLEIQRIAECVETAFSLLNEPDAHLVHGDFDYTHIFTNSGTYTGIIDFGEIMGNNHLFDLAHFWLFSTHPVHFEALKTGYREIHQLSEDDNIKIDLLTMLLGIWKLKQDPQHHKYFASIIKRQLNAVS